MDLNAWFYFNIAANEANDTSSTPTETPTEEIDISSIDRRGMLTYFFDTSAFDDVRKISRNTKVSEGLEECPSCGSKRLIIRQMQTRSADEAATNFYRCIGCHRVWSS
jgi:DNA-directed RNA polymerase subunit M/transcription elongation factor TFIIS